MFALPFPGNLDLLSSRCPDEDIGQSIDLRVDGIANDETYKDEQCMQRIAEQVQKLMFSKEIFKDNSPQYNILREKIVKKICSAPSSWMDGVTAPCVG